MPRAARPQARGRRAGPRRGRACRARRRRPRPRAASGMDVDVARVAKREPGMNAVEVMTSESQERMLAIVEPEQLDAVLDARAQVGDPRHGRRARHRHRPVPRVRRSVRRARCARREPARRRSATRAPSVSSDRAPVADVPVGSLGDGPLYHRPVARPAEQDALQADDPAPRLRAKFRAGRRPRAASCSRCSPRRRSPTRRGCRASTTTSCSSTRSPARAPTPRCCA